GRSRYGCSEPGIFPLLRREISRASRHASFSVSGSRQIVAPIFESKKSGRSICVSLSSVLSCARRSHSLRAWKSRVNVWFSAVERDEEWETGRGGIVDRSVCGFRAVEQSPKENP